MILFYIFALLLIYFSYRSWRGGVEYLNYFRRETSKQEPLYAPFASIIVPCRGVDTDLSKNLDTLFKQDYPAYEILFVVDNANDPAVKTIENVTRKNYKKVPTKLVIADPAEREGQKVHNLREAILHVSEDSKIYAFIDSDAAPHADWLKALVNPLQNDKIGATTGYRWFFSKTGGFASEMLAMWNASIASTLGADMKSNFCWGGSMAMRRGKLKSLDVRERWRGTLSDDFTLTNILKENNLPVYFVPQALLPTVEDCDFSQLLEFTTRQMKITAVYSREHWVKAFAGAVLFLGVVLTAFLIMIFAPVKSIAFWAAFITLVVVAWFSVMKSRLRLHAVEIVISEYHKQIAAQMTKQSYLWALSPAVYLYNSFASIFSKKIVWRGIEYKMDSAHRTTITEKK